MEGSAPAGKCDTAHTNVPSATAVPTRLALMSPLYGRSQVGNPYTAGLPADVATRP